MLLDTVHNPELPVTLGAEKVMKLTGSRNNNHFKSPSDAEQMQHAEVTTENMSVKRLSPVCLAKFPETRRWKKQPGVGFHLLMVAPDGQGHLDLSRNAHTDLTNGLFDCARYA